MSKVQTIIWTELCTLSKSMLKWDVTGFWQTFEDVHNSDIWAICWFFINQNLLFYQRVRDLVIRAPPGFRLNGQVSSSARCCGSHVATGVQCINAVPAEPFEFHGNSFLLLPAINDLMYRGEKAGGKVSAILWLWPRDSLLSSAWNVIYVQQC